MGKTLLHLRSSCALKSLLALATTFCIRLRMPIRALVEFPIGNQLARYLLLYPNCRPNGVTPVGAGIDGSDCAVAAAVRAFRAVEPNAARSTNSAHGAIQVAKGSTNLFCE